MTTTPPAQASDEPMRAAFEKWAESEPISLHLNGAGEYMSYEAHIAWKAWQAFAALKAQPAPTEAQGEDSARLECNHMNTKPSYEWVDCLDCGSIKTDFEKEWSIAKNRWFKSVDEANFYRKNGRLPDRARASAETGGVKS